MSDEAGLRAVVQSQEMIYSGPFAGSVCSFTDPFSGSSGNGANAYREYQCNRLFFENMRSKQN